MMNDVTELRPAPPAVMDADQMRVERGKLNRTIADAIITFQQATGLAVVEIEVNPERGIRALVVLP